MRVVLGIDPGKNGALVVLCEERGVVFCLGQALTADFVVDGEYQPSLMWARVRELRLEHKVTRGVLERVSVRPLEGVSSACTSGKGWGLWRMALAGLVDEVIEPTPAKWTKVGLEDQVGEGKARAISRASQIPGLNLTPKGRRRLHDGLADAACLALYGLRQ